MFRYAQAVYLLLEEGRRVPDAADDTQPACIGHRRRQLGACRDLSKRENA